MSFDFCLCLTMRRFAVALLIVSAHGHAQPLLFTTLRNSAQLCLCSALLPLASQCPCCALPCQAVPLLRVAFDDLPCHCPSLSCHSLPVSAFPCFSFAARSLAELLLCCARRNPAEPSFAFAQPIDAMPCHCEAYQIIANPRHCPVRRAYQPAFSSGKKLSSSFRAS